MKTENKKDQFFESFNHLFKKSVDGQLLISNKLKNYKLSSKELKKLVEYQFNRLENGWMD